MRIKNVSDKTITVLGTDIAAGIEVVFPDSIAEMAMQKYPVQLKEFKEDKILPEKEAITLTGKRRPRNKTGKRAPIKKNKVTKRRLTNKKK